MDEANKIQEYTLCFVLDKKSNCLMIQRRHPPHQGLWNAPGGKLAGWESARDCCAREVAEETGLRVIPRPAGIVECLDQRQPGITYRLHVFKASHRRVAVRGGREGKLAWVPLDALTRGAGIVHNIPLFLPLVLANLWFSARFNYRGDYLLDYAVNLAEKGDGMPLNNHSYII